LRDYLILGIKKRPTSIRPIIVSQVNIGVKNFFKKDATKFVAPLHHYNVSPLLT